MICGHVFVHKYDACTATDRYCCSITNSNYLERRAETEEMIISWHDWKFHMATVSKASEGDIFCSRWYCCIFVMCMNGTICYPL